MYDFHQQLFALFWWISLDWLLFVLCQVWNDVEGEACGFKTRRSSAAYPGADPDEGSWLAGRWHAITNNHIHQCLPRKAAKWRNINSVGYRVNQCPSIKSVSDLYDYVVLLGWWLPNHTASVWFGRKHCLHVQSWLVADKKEMHYRPCPHFPWGSREPLTT